MISEIETVNTLKKSNSNGWKQYNFDSTTLKTKQEALD